MREVPLWCWKFQLGMVKGVTGEVPSRHFTSWQFVLVDEKAWEDLISALANLTDEEDLNYNHKLRLITVLYGRVNSQKRASSANVPKTFFLE